MANTYMYILHSYVLSSSRPVEMSLDLEDADGGAEKLGTITAVFTLHPKNLEDRQEVIFR